MYSNERKAGNFSQCCNHYCSRLPSSRRMAFMSFTLCSADRAAAAVVSAVAYMYSAMCNKNKYDNGHGKLSLHRLHTRAHNVMLTLSSRQAKGLRLRGKYFSVLMAVSAVNGT